MTVQTSTFTTGGRTWQARSEYADSVRAVADLVDGLGDASLIKRNLSREVHQLGAVVEGGPELIVKHHRVRGMRDALKYLVVASRAKTEWSVSLAMEELGIPVAKTLGFSEVRRKGVLLTEAISISEKLSDAGPLAPAMTDPQRSDEIFDKLVRLIVQMHAAGVEHTDLHGGNLLVSDDDSITVIDLHAVAIDRRLSRRKRVASVGQLLWSLSAVIDADGRKRFVKGYLDEAGIVAATAERFLHRVNRWIARYDRRRFRSRTKRCIINSSKFCIDRPEGMRVYRRRSVPLEAIQSAVDAHREAVAAEADTVLKSDDRSSVSRQELDGTDVCVKGFVSRGLSDGLVMRLWRSRGKRTWIAGNGLIVRGVPAPEPLAEIDDRRTGDSFVITRYIDDATPLDAWVRGPGKNCPPAERRELVDTLAGVVGRLHEVGVVAEDLSAKNILVRSEDDGWQAWIIDLDNTHLWRRLTRSRRLWNLAQLNDIPTSISPGERFRFLQRYIKSGNSVLRREDADVIMQLSRRRHKRWFEKMQREQTRKDT